MVNKYAVLVRDLRYLQFKIACSTNDVANIEFDPGQGCLVFRIGPDFVDKVEVHRHKPVFDTHNLADAKFRFCATDPFLSRFEISHMMLCLFVLSTVDLSAAVFGLSWSLLPIGIFMDNQTKTELEAASFRRLVDHLGENTNVQNIDLMNLAGFCRNCLSKWYRAAAEDKGIDLDYEEARQIIYGMPYSEWKSKYQTDASPEQQAAFDNKSH